MPTRAPAAIAVGLYVEVEVAPKEETAEPKLAGMRRLTRWSTVAGALAIALVGCGGGARSSGASSTALNPDQTQGATTCGHKDVRIELHDSSCETVETMINLLNGRAKHSVLTLADEFGKVKWVCMKPSHSLYAPLRCTSGKRYFAMTFSAH